MVPTLVENSKSFSILVEICWFDGCSYVYKFRNNFLPSYTEQVATSQVSNIFRSYCFVSGGGH